MHVLIQVDGGSRGNPGPAAAGVTITDPSGRPIFEAGFHLEPMTNNQAEYHGLLYALREAKRLGATRLDIKADSELLVRQINGQYKVKNEGLRPLYARAISLLREFDAWRMVHVRREGNTRADELANLAMDAGDDVIELAGVPAASGIAAEPPTRLAETPVNVLLRCSVAPDARVCPAPCEAGWSVHVTSATPAGLCIHPASTVFAAVCTIRDHGPGKMIDCPRPRCGGRFVIEPSVDAGAKPGRPTPKRS